MDEAHYAEVEKALLYVSEARQRCERTHRRLVQETLFAVPQS